MGCCVSADEQFDYDAELFKQQNIRSVEVKDSGETAALREKGELKDWGPVRRHARHPDHLIDAPFEGKDDQETCRTVFYAFQRSVDKFPESYCMGARKLVDGKVDFAWHTYAQTAELVKSTAAVLVSLGLKPGDTIGICSANRVEWTVVALAAYSQGMTVVALYDTLGADAVEYIINHSDAKLAVCSKKKLPIVLAVLSKCPKLKDVIQFDANPLYGNDAEAVADGDRKVAEEKNVKLHGLEKIKAEVKANPPARLFNPPSSQDLAFIMYTSGTTGQPKGVMLTHGNIMACVAGVLRASINIKNTDVHLSYLPLAHIFETAVQAALMANGGSIAFFGGDVKALTDDIKAAQPTIFAGVPRVFTRMYDRVMSLINSANGIKKCVFLRKYQKQCFLLRRGLPIDESAENIMKKVRAGMGLGRCRVIVTGAAPCPPYLMEFLRVCINPEQGVVQGYGMTETAAAVSLTETGDHTLGHVGPPLPSAEIRLRDVPEMGYLHTNNPPTGEILARGPSIFVGYFKNEEATRTTIEHGWIATGDVGRWNPNGTLSIIDRKKNIFKLAHGEYVASEKLEQIFARCELASQVFVYGNSYKPFLVAVIVPNAENAAKYCKEKGWWGNDGEAKFASDAWRKHFQNVIEQHRAEFSKAVLDSFTKAAGANHLLPYEQIKDLYVEPELDDVLQGFTVANDCMTPSFKLRRPFLLQRYKQQIIELYTKNGEAPKPDEKW